MSVASLLDAILSVVYPFHCKLCSQFIARRETGPICPLCWTEIELLEPPLCSRCGCALNEVALSAGRLCPECLRHTPPFACARSAAAYRGQLREMVHLFKFQGRLDIGKKLASLLVSLYRRTPELAADVVLPVPLHKKRLKARGFNQSEVLARALARCCRLPLANKALARKKNTPPQSELAGRARRKNVAKAFVAQRPFPLAGKRVLLVDDIYTTGSTVAECSRTLLAAGARQVAVLTLARAAKSSS